MADDDNTDERWNGIIQDAVKGFVSSVEASSRQMAQARSALPPRPRE
jgi:hypothetical protein